MSHPLWPLSDGAILDGSGERSHDRRRRTHHLGQTIVVGVGSPDIAGPIDRQRIWVIQSADQKTGGALLSFLVIFQ
jgi:hypothetical protein